MLFRSSLRDLSNRLSGLDESLGVEKKKIPFQPFTRPKFKEGKAIEVTKEKGIKVESAIQEVLPKKRGRPKKEEKKDEFIPQQRKKFAIKSVTQIRKKKKKS